jgi:hypothetical protein
MTTEKKRTKVLHKEISCCWECPYAWDSPQTYDTKWRCSVLDITIHDTLQILDTCPLDDLKGDAQCEPSYSYTSSTAWFW